MSGWSVGTSMPRGWRKTQRPSGVWAQRMLWWQKRQCQESWFDVLTVTVLSKRGESKYFLLELSFYPSPTVAKPMPVVLFVWFLRKKSLLRHLSCSVPPLATGLWTSEAFPMAKADKWEQPAGTLWHALLLMDCHTLCFLEKGKENGIACSSKGSSKV